MFKAWRIRRLEVYVARLTARYNEIMKTGKDGKMDKYYVDQAIETKEVLAAFETKLKQLRGEK